MCKAGRPGGDAECEYTRQRGAAMEDKLKARIERLDDGGLAELRAEIEALLADRKEAREREEQERASAEQARKERLEEAARARVGEWVEHEMRACGSDRCTKCVGGYRAHGPYWYRYLFDGGVYKSKYVGKELDSHAARVLAAHEEKRRAKTALRRGHYRERITAENLVGLMPEEVFPEEFTSTEREAAKRRKAARRRHERDEGVSDGTRVDASKARA